MRQYSDLKYGDIDTRFVSDDLRWTKKEKNALNNRRRREVRERYHVRDWSGRYADCVTKTLLEFVEDLSPEQVAHNTSWVVTPTGIHPPGLPTCKYPLDSYLEDGAPHTASKEIQNALELLTKLNKKARRQGKTNWRHLPEKDLPPRWFSRLAGTRKRKIEPDENEPEDDSQVVTRGQSAYSGDSDADSGLRRLAVQASRIDETEHQAEEEEDSHTKVQIQRTSPNVSKADSGFKELVDSGASETDGTEYQAEEEENNQAGVTDRASSLDVSQAYDGFKALTDDWASKHDETGHHSADEGGESSLTRRKRRKIESMNLVVLGLAE